MYKDKKLGALGRYSNTPSLVVLILLSAVCIVYVFIKVTTTSTTDSASIATNKQASIDSPGNIASGHSSAQIDYEPILKDVEEQYREQCRSILQGKQNIAPDSMWSSNFEDWFIYHNFFTHPSYHFHSSSNFDERQNRKDAFGVYLDIGSFQPYKHSVTAFFDICLGWSGLCVWSPDLAVNKFFGSTRSCNPVAHECLWRPDNKGARSDSAFCGHIDRYIKDVVEEYQFHDRFQHQYTRPEHQFEIDLVALSIEGAEFEFLKCFPFELYSVKVWSIRSIDTYTNKVDELLLSNGYFKFEQLSLYGAHPSMIYARKDAVYPWTEETVHRFRQSYECKMVTPDLHN